MNSVSEQGVPPPVLSLRTKTLLVFSVVLVVFMAAYLGLVSTVLLGTLGRVQKELALQRVELVVRQLNQVARQQQQMAADNALWTEAFDFLRGLNAGFMERNFGSAKATSGQDAVFLFDAHRNLAGSSYFGAEAGGGSLLLDPEVLRTSGLFRGDDSATVAIAAPEGMFLVSAHPVARSDGSGKSPGWLAFGLRVNQRWFEDARLLTGVVVSPSYPPSRLPAPPLQQVETLRTDALGECRVFMPLAERAGAHGAEATVDIGVTVGGAPAELNLLIPGTVFTSALAMRHQIFWISVLGTLGLVFILWVAVEFLFIRRIRVLDGEFEGLAEREDFSARLVPMSRDELGRMALSANRLLDSLRRGRAESRVQEQLLSGVLDAATEGVIAFRSLRTESRTVSDFIIVLANEAAARSLARPAADMVGKCLLGLFPGHMEEGIFDRYVRVVESRIPEDFEIFYNHEEVRAWFHIGASPWNDGLVVVFEEVTERKRVEQELRASVAEMERFNRAMLGREHRILEMKSEVNRLREKLGLPPAYEVDSRSDVA